MYRGQGLEVVNIDAGKYGSKIYDKEFRDRVEKEIATQKPDALIVHLGFTDFDVEAPRAAWLRSILNRTVGEGKTAVYIDSSFTKRWEDLDELDVTYDVTTGDEFVAYRCRGDLAFGTNSPQVGANLQAWADADKHTHPQAVA